MSLLFSKKMPQKFNVSDGRNSFTLGRKVFLINLINLMNLKI